MFMFDSLDEQMKHDDAAGTTARQRMLKWALIAIASLLFFGGVYAAIRMLG
jgi:hypothetical protein